MKKISTPILVLSFLLILLPTSIFADDSTQEEALASLSNAELIAYIGNTGSIGMEGAAHPSVLYILSDDNEKNDNSVNGSSNTLLKELEELEGIFNSLDPGEDYGGLEEKSYSYTGYTFLQRLGFLNNKLDSILTELEDSGINNDKRKDLIVSRLESVREMIVNIRNIVNPVCVDFSDLAEGASVEGSGVVSLYLDIDTSTDGAVKIVENGTLNAYGSPNAACYEAPAIPPPIVHNGGITIGGGFSDMEAVNANDPHSYTFSFEGVTVSSFTLHMLDFGDWNPSNATYHKAEMIAYAESSQVSNQVLEYSTLPDNTPNESSLPNYGDLQCNTGDASSESGYPGNWTWTVSGEGITQVILTFPEGHDPYIGFDSLCFVVEP